MMMIIIIMSKRMMMAIMIGNGNICKLTINACFGQVIIVSSIENTENINIPL
jgi:hypothetical protein